MRFEKKSMIGDRIIVQILRIIVKTWYTYFVQPIVRMLPKRSGKRILCFGDSNTWGYIPQTGLRFRFGKRWTGIVQNELGKEFHVIEEGLNGRTTVLDDPEQPGRNGKTSLPSFLRRYQPLDLVVLLLGTNDLKAHLNRTAEQIADGMGELSQLVMTSHISSNGTSPFLLLIAPPPIKTNDDYAALFDGAEAKSVQLGDRFSQIAKETHCAYLDAGQLITTSQLDGVHWDEEAHKKLGKIVAQTVREILSKTDEQQPEQGGTEKQNI